MTPLQNSEGPVPVETNGRERLWLLGGYRDRAE